MIYTLEYLNEDAEIEILRYNEETKEFQIVTSHGQNTNYEEPTRKWIFLNKELDGESTTDSSGVVKAWSQKLGEFRPEMKTENGFEQTDGVVFVRAVVANDMVSSFMESMIKGVDKNKGQMFVQDYDIGKTDQDDD